MAKRLAEGLGRLNSTRLLYPVEANEIFIALPAAANKALEAAGFKYYPWPSDRPGEQAYRLVTAFDTDPAHVDRFVAVAASP